MNHLSSRSPALRAALATLLLALTGCEAKKAPVAGAASPTKLRVGYNNGSLNRELFLETGRALGIFERHGLELEDHGYTVGGQIAQAGSLPLSSPHRARTDCWARAADQDLRGDPQLRVESPNHAAATFSSRAHSDGLHGGHGFISSQTLTVLTSTPSYAECVPTHLIHTIPSKDRAPAAFLPPNSAW